MIDEKIQKNNYFEFRNISEKNYENAKLPLWIQNEIDEKDLNILDYGCGFGQNLVALKNLGYTNIFGVDIELSAIKYCVERGVQCERA